MTLDDLAFALEQGLGYAAKIHLLDVFGSAESIYSANKQELIDRAELRPQIAEALARKQAHKKAEQEARFMQRHDIKAVASTDPEYPALLRECNDYPHVLYVKGDPAAMNEHSISMVGTRKITGYGQAVCNRLVGDLAQLMPGAVITSGLAFGVDVACHRAALASGLRTVAVLANPLDSVYPSAHHAVAGDIIARGGALVSEISSQDAPHRGNFVQRNRIIAGLSAGTVVVQSPAGGGSILTATHVDGYGRILMAPPANIGEVMCEGTNMLIKSLKAHMICSAADILDELCWLKKEDAAPQDDVKIPEDKAQAAVYKYICDNPGVTTEQIEAKTGINFQALTMALFELEFDALIRQRGGRYEKFRI